MKKIVTLFATVLLLYGCGSVPLTGRKQMLLVSDSEVLSSSLTQYSEYIKSAPISSNATKKAMVTRVGKKIAAATEQYLENNGMSGEVRNFSWEFNLVKDNQVNAFCMPGGKIVVYEGLMNLVSSDDELAVVIGHEVAHAVAKHSNERMSQQLVAQYGVMLPFSRKHETEADYMGLILMTMAGYNPNVAVTFWQKMSAGGSGSVPEIMSTHPSDATRISDIRKHLPEMKKYK